METTIETLSAKFSELNITNKLRKDINGIQYIDIPVNDMYMECLHIHIKGRFIAVANKYWDGTGEQAAIYRITEIDKLLSFISRENTIKISKINNL